MSRLIEHLFPDFLDLPVQSSLNLADRILERKPVLRLNDVHNGFRLRQVDSSVQICTLRKLPRLCGSRPGLQNSLQNTGHSQNASMAADLHHILRRIGPRCTHDRNQHLIDHIGRLLRSTRYTALQSISGCFRLDNKAIVNGMSVHFRKSFLPAR